MRFAESLQFLIPSKLAVSSLSYVLKSGVSSISVPILEQKVYLYILFLTKLLISETIVLLHFKALFALERCLTNNLNFSEIYMI